MNIVKTSQGYNISELIINPHKKGHSDYLVKMHYIGYSKKECIKRFNILKKEQMKFLNYVNN